jgi:two-component system cell cycle sensor histidine kinase/response regulator CckA
LENASDPFTIEEFQEARLSQFCLDRASVSALRLHQDGSILYANREASRTLGYLPAELLKMSIFDIDPNVDRGMWPQIWQKLCEDGANTFESLHRRKDGTLFPIEVTATLIEFEGRRYSMALVKDITEKQRVLESLRTARFIFEKASFGVFVIKDGGHITNVNAHACRYLGYTKQELCRMNILEIDAGYTPEENEQLRRRLLEKGAVTFESVHRRKDGTHVPVAITGNRFEFGNETYGVSFVLDITERKEAERQRLKMEAQMRETQKLESLGTLAGGIAHDFNNILAAILGYAQLAQLQCQADSNLKKYVSQIFQAGQRAKELVDQILAFSRQGRSEKRPLDIGRVVAEALKLIKATLPANIEIRENIPPDLAPVSANEVQIHQIVMNLCTNAHHAMKTTGGRLHVSFTAAAIQQEDARNYPGMKPGDYLKLSIADTGCGIAPKTINRIFDPYFTTKPTGQGTGLGLSTVHGIVQDHGGAITVYSEVGAGTTMHVFLPAADAAVQDAAVQAVRLPTGNERILFVDDEKALIDLGRDLLEQLGYRVETRASAIDAIQAFKADPQKYDLVISDMTMPKMTGDELARQIKAIRPGIPIILCSGFSDRIHAPETEAIGLSAVLMKPVTYAELAHAVRKAIDAGIGSSK